MESVANQIEKKITNGNRGRFLFPSDFFAISTPANAGRTLQRLAEQELILRISPGVYFYPRIDTKYGLGVIMPSTTDIALAIAKRDKVSIFPSGPYALNALGLSSQVPMNAVFTTNGAPRRVDIGKGRTITFRHSGNARNFQYWSKEIQLVVSALKELGEENITDEHLDKIRPIIKAVPSEKFNHDLALAPAWIINILKCL